MESEPRALVPGLSLAVCLFITLATQAQSQAWPMQGHDPARASRTTVAGPPTANLLWTYEFTGDRLQDNSSPVVDSTGTVYVATEGGLYAIDQNGQLKWSVFEPTSPLTRAAPALSPDESTVYRFEGVLAAHSTIDGSQIWTFPIGTNWSSLAVDPAGTLYRGGSVIYAVEQDGDLLWSQPVLRSNGDDCLLNGPLAVDSLGAVYGVDQCILEQSLRKVDAAGTRWKHQGLFFDGWGAPLIGPSDTVFIAGDNGGGFCCPSQSFGVYAYETNGDLKWVNRGIQAPGTFHGMALSADDGALYTASGRGKVYALDSETGGALWASTIGPVREDFGGSPALAGNGILYLMGNRGEPPPGGTKVLPGENDFVYAVSAANGRVLWQYELATTSFFWGPSSPAIGPDGTLYVLSPGNFGILGLTTPARLYAFGRDDDALPSVVIADTLVQEGDGLASSASFDLSLSFAVSTPVTVQYQTRDGAARSGLDYVATSGEITFSPGATHQILAVEVLPDASEEPPEALFVDLVEASGASLTDSGARATIIDGTVTSLLLVDAEGSLLAEGQGVLPLFMAALEELDLDYGIWDLESQGVPTATSLDSYEIVIWFTGSDFFTGELTPASETHLGNWLDGGGCLVMSSEQEQEASAFLQQYLGVAELVDGTFGSPPCEYETISGASSAFVPLGRLVLNLTDLDEFPFPSPDSIVPTASGLTILSVDDPQANCPTAAAVGQQTNTYRTVFSAAPISIISSAFERRSFLSRAFGFCAYEELLLFEDGFESGDTSRWSSAPGPSG